MNIVCIDTSSANLSITVQGPEGIFTSVFKPAKRRHSYELIPAIEFAIKKAGFSVKDINILACPQGPGGFTGLRLAYAAAKAIQFQTEAKFYSIPVLAALAFRYGQDAEQFLAILDANRERFYTQAFSFGNPISEAQDIGAEQAINLIDSDKNCLVCGFGTEKFRKELTTKKLYNLSFIEYYPENLSQIMLKYILSNRVLVEVKDYDGPIYIRKSDAEK